MHTVVHTNRQSWKILGSCTIIGKENLTYWKTSVKIENLELRMCETAKAGEVARLGGADSVLKGLAKSTMYGTN